MGYFDKLKEYGFKTVDDKGARCINCRHIDCRTVKCKGNRIRVHCKELSLYFTEDIYTKVNCICDFYKIGCSTNNY